MSGRRGWRGAVAAVALAALLLLPALALRPRVALAAPPGVRIQATASFGGNYRQGEWVPIAVELANDGPDVTGDVVLEVGGPSGGTNRFVQRVDLPTGSRKALTLYALAPSYTTAVKVSFSTGKDAVAAPPIALRMLGRDQRLIGVVGDDAGATNAIASSLLAAYGSAVVTVAATPAELPGNPYGLDSFTALVLDDASTGTLGADQRRALADWVALGGRVVLAGGPSWRKTLEGLGDLPPVRPEDSRTVAGLAGLAGLGGGGAAPAGQFVVASGAVVAGGAALASQDGAPLVALRGWGRGTVAYLAFDPAAPNFLTWGGARTFWKGLRLDAATAADLQGPFDASGGGASRVDGILRDLPALGLPPTWLLILVMLAFIAVVGPVNYLVLRRLDRRELGWVTIPVLTLVCAGAIYGVGAATKGGDVTVNTVAVVRIAPGERAAEAQTFYGVFTPSNGARQLPVGHDALVAGFGPNGIGGGDFGGDIRYVQGPDAAARDAYFSQWTLRSVAAQAVVDPAPLALRLELRQQGGQVVGQVTNVSGRPVTDVVLLLDGAYTRLGDLAAGASAPVSWTPTPSHLAGIYGPGLGSAIYYGGGYHSGQGGGAVGHRAELLDALSGGVLGYAGQPVPVGGVVRSTSGLPGQAPSAATLYAQYPLQVLYWSDDAPLPLGVGAGQEHVTTLVIQETYLGGATPDHPPVLAGATP
ncbi:MAG TPA: hypothetical protein VFW96_15465 [Thermomicrobiales bacterium]|nr:hypothetical protein [Thermomicrobiales bacterium]